MHAIMLPDLNELGKEDDKRAHPCHQHCRSLTTAQEEGHRRARITLAMNVSSFGSSQGVCGGQRKCLTWCRLLTILIIEDLTPYVDTG